MKQYGIIPIVLVFLLGVFCGGPKSVEELRKAGQQAFLDQDYKKAREYMLAALEKAPSDKQLLYFTGLAYKMDYIMDSALIYLKRADIHYPDDREIAVNIYEVATAIGEWKYAQEAVMTLVRTGDNEADYYEALADLWNNQGSFFNTFYYLRKMWIEQGIHDQKRFIQIASLAAQIDSLAVADSVLDSAITRFGMNDDLLLVRAKILFNKRKLDEAESLLRELAERHPDNPEIKANLGNALINKGGERNKREALTLYREIRNRMPDPIAVDSIIANIERDLAGDTGGQ